MKRPAQKRPTSSPRSLRGLEWWCCAGLLALVIGGIVHARRTPAPASGIRSNLEPAAAVAEISRERSKSEKTPREVYWEKMLAAIAMESDSDEREQKLRELAEGVPVADIAATLAELRNIGEDNGSLAVELLRRWAGQDGRAAATWVEQLSAGATRQNDLQAVAIEWANRDASNASAWARSLTDPAESQSVGLAVANEVVRDDPVEALRLAVTLPGNSERDELLRHAAMEWAAQDASDAVAWAETISDGALRAKVLAAEAVSWAEHDPVAAADLVLDKLPAGRTQQDALISIVQRWAQQQPEAAAAWVEQFPAGPLRAVAMENLLAQWSQTDPAGAAAWRVAHS